MLSLTQVRTSSLIPNLIDPSTSRPPSFIENQVLHFGKPDSILPEISKRYINVKTLCESIIKEENGTE